VRKMDRKKFTLKTMAFFEKLAQGGKTVWIWIPWTSWRRNQVTELFNQTSQIMTLFPCFFVFEIWIGMCTLSVLLGHASSRPLYRVQYLNFGCRWVMPLFSLSA
jgi:hypothetical protein